jgi:hypothetical protein
MHAADAHINAALADLEFVLPALAPEQAAHALRAQQNLLMALRRMESPVSPELIERFRGQVDRLRVVRS